MKIRFVIAIVTCFTFTACGQFTPTQIGQILGGGNGVLSTDEIARGLKEALQVGISNGSAQASKVDGYFGNNLIKLAFPPDAQKVENTLRQIGLGGEVDKFVVTLNRAAEQAAIKAKPIFVKAITNMSISDAIGILKGQPNAATQYLRQTTYNELYNEFAPVMESSLGSTNATKYYTDLANSYNKIPLTSQKLNPDLKKYATDKAIDGLFTLVAQEEQKIRENPAARVSDLLKKVFANN